MVLRSRGRFVAPSVLAVLATVLGGADTPILDVPPGFIASEYVRGIPGAHDISVGADGTVRLRGHEGREVFEIVPPSGDAPVTVMRVAAELATRGPRTRITALAAPPPQGDAVTYDLPVAAGTLALARTFAREEFADVALSPDGTLYVADARAGTVYRVRRTGL